MSHERRTDESSTRLSTSPVYEHRVNPSTHFIVCLFEISNSCTSHRSQTVFLCTSHFHVTFRRRLLMDYVPTASTGSTFDRTICKQTALVLDAFRRRIAINSSHSTCVTGCWKVRKCTNVYISSQSSHQPPSLMSASLSQFVQICPLCVRCTNDSLLITAVFCNRPNLTTHRLRVHNTIPFFIFTY